MKYPNSEEQKMKRRQFMKGAAVAGAAGISAGTVQADKPAGLRARLKRDFIRVGMVGLGPYSHAMAYTQALNEPSVPPRTNMKVVAVWGKSDNYRSSFKGSDEFIGRRLEELTNYQSRDKYANELGVEHIVRQPEDMVKLVDAAFIMDPEDSYNLARPFLEAGKPIFVNRPFAWSLDEAEKLLALAKSRGAAVISGSCVPWMNEFQVVKMQLADKKIQHYYTDGSTANFCSYMPHILETAQMLVGGKVVRCSTHGMTWSADEDPLSIPPVMTHLEYEKTSEDHDPVIGVASTWYGKPYRNWTKVHCDHDVLEQGIYWESGGDRVAHDEHLWMPLLRVIDRTFETNASPEIHDDIINKVSTMLMAHKSGVNGGNPVGINEIRGHVLPRFETEKA